MWPNNWSVIGRKVVIWYHRETSYTEPSSGVGTATKNYNYYKKVSYYAVPKVQVVWHYSFHISPEDQLSFIWSRRHDFQEVPWKNEPVFVVRFSFTTSESAPPTCLFLVSSQSWTMGKRSFSLPCWSCSLRSRVWQFRCYRLLRPVEHRAALLKGAPVLLLQDEDMEAYACVSSACEGID